MQKYHPLLHFWVLVIGDPIPKSPLHTLYLAEQFDNFILWHVIFIQQMCIAFFRAQHELALEVLLGEGKRTSQFLQGSLNVQAIQVVVVAKFLLAITIHTSCGLSL